MAKDPAVLVYIDTWIASTNGMKACYRAWYFDLLLYQYDKGEVPNDIDELAGICRVRPSEYDLFKQVVEQVLKQKFKQTKSGCYVNEVANEIISKRQQFKSKRAKSGTIGAIVKKAGGIKGFNKTFIDRLKNELFEKDLNELEEYKDENLLKQVLKLYKDGDGDGDIDIDTDIDVDTIKEKKGGVEEKKEIELPYDSEKFKTKWGEWKEYKHKEHRFRYKTAMSEQAALSKLTNLARGEPEAIQIIQEAIANGWKGFYPLKQNNQNGKQKPDPRFDDRRSKFVGASKRRGTVKFT